MVSLTDTRNGSSPAGRTSPRTGTRRPCPGSWLVGGLPLFFTSRVTLAPGAVGVTLPLNLIFWAFFTFACLASRVTFTLVLAVLVKTYWFGP